MINSKYIGVMRGKAEAVFNWIDMVAKTIDFLDRSEGFNEVYWESHNYIHRN